MIHELKSKFGFGVNLALFILQCIFGLPYTVDGRLFKLSKSSQENWNALFVKKE